MDPRLVYLTTLFLLYFIHDGVLSRRFRRTFRKDPNFLGKNAPNDAQRHLGRALRSIMAYYLLALVHLVSGFGFWGLGARITILGRSPLPALGFVLGLAFLVLMTAARLNLGGSWRVGLDRSTTDDLVTSGFYRFIRNPYFTFLLGFEGALILVCPNPLVVFAFIQSAVLLGLQARLEEELLEEIYGERYLAYKRATGRFLPKIGR